MYITSSVNCLHNFIKDFVVPFLNIHNYIIFKVGVLLIFVYTLGMINYCNSPTPNVVFVYI
jgi:hypothetical protein